MAVKHDKVTEQPALQGVTLLPSLRFQGDYLGFHLVNHRFSIGNLKGQTLLHAMQFGLQKLRTAYHFGRQLLGATFLFALDFNLECRKLPFSLMRRVLPFAACSC